jgi:hypothetical protein
MYGNAISQRARARPSCKKAVLPLRLNAAKQTFRHKAASRMAALAKQPRA